LTVALNSLLEGGIVGFEFGEEGVDVGDVEEFLWDKGLDGDIGDVDVETELAGKDEAFAGDIHAGEVILGLGLGVALGNSFTDRLGEGGADHRLIGEVAQGTGEGTLDAVDTITSAAEVLEGFDDGETGTHCGFVMNGTVMLASCIEQIAVVLLV